MHCVTLRWGFKVPHLFLSVSWLLPLHEGFAISIPVMAGSCPASSRTASLFLQEFTQNFCVGLLPFRYWAPRPSEPAAVGWGKGTTHSPKTWQCCPRWFSNRNRGSCDQGKMNGCWEAESTHVLSTSKTSHCDI